MIYLRTFFYLLLAAILALVQLSFISGLPAWFSGLNLVIFFLIFSIEFGDSKILFWQFLLIGFLFGLYSPLPFGFWLVFWPLSVLLIRLLWANFFTNRSLYSFLALTFFSELFYIFVLNFSVYFWKRFSDQTGGLFLWSSKFWLSLFSNLAINFIFIFIAFYLTNLASNRLKPVFLFRK